MADRSDYLMRTIEVQHVAVPLGTSRENPPHLGDLRAFIAMCDGLPDELFVTVAKGKDYGYGRRDLVLSVSLVEPVPDHPDWL